MTECGGVGELFPPFLTSAPDGGGLSDSRPSRFIPGRKATDSHRGEQEAAEGTGTEKGLLPLPAIELQCVSWPACSRS